jgi:hypothetical protein
MCGPLVGGWPDADVAVHGLPRRVRHPMAGLIVAENSDGDAIDVPPVYIFLFKQIKEEVLFYQSIKRI